MKQFIEKGGYALLERVGTGSTSEERQIDAWSQYGIMTQLIQQTDISKPTLYSIKEWFPTQNEAGVEMFWISRENLNLLNDARERLVTAEKRLKRISELAERSLIVDSTTVRMQQQILGLSIEEAFKNVVKAAEKMDNPIKDSAEDLMIALRDTRSIINQVQFSAKKLSK